MASFEIIGGKKLKGKVQIAGNKNAVLPIMAACLLTKDECKIENVPNISDVEVMARLLEIAGAKIEKVNKSTLKISCKNIKKSKREEGNNEEGFNKTLHTNGPSLF